LARRQNSELKNMQRIEIHLPILIPNLFYRLSVFILLKYRLLRYGYSFRLIRLGPGQYSKVDPEDYEWLSIYNWHLLTGPTNRYAVRVDRKRLFVHMHREIMKPPKGMVVDHINRDGLDNRRANLRIATRQQNRCNSGPRLRRGTSKYKGVSWDKVRRKWRAYLSSNGKGIHLGRFDNEFEAAKVRDAAAKKYHGQFAWLNFPDD